MLRQLLAGGGTRRQRRSEQDGAGRGGALVEGEQQRFHAGSLTPRQVRRRGLARSHPAGAPQALLDCIAELSAEMTAWRQHPREDTICAAGRRSWVPGISPLCCRNTPAASRRSARRTPARARCRCTLPCDFNDDALPVGASSFTTLVEQELPRG
ncbi:hypothetical protein ACFQU2_25440 [Siccirubricoccus deserti]